MIKVTYVKNGLSMEFKVEASDYFSAYDKTYPQVLEKIPNFSDVSKGSSLIRYEVLNK